MKHLAKLGLIWCIAVHAVAAVWALSLDDSARAVASLIDPAKLATLYERGANVRVQKYVALLAEAQKQGIAPKKLAGRAVAIAGMKGEAAKLTAQAMLRNFSIADRLGCLDADGLTRMRHGQPPIVRRGHYRDQELSVDHIIPRAIVPELDNVIANLELLPLRSNKQKNAKIGARQADLGRKLHHAGLLTPEGLKSIERALSQTAPSHPPSPNSEATAALHAVTPRP